MDAFLLVSYGAPERKEDVIPFLHNVLAGKNVPPERLERVAEKYYEFARQTGRFSPLHEECRSLLSGILQELDEFGPKLSVYWGNLHWEPLLDETVAEMVRDGVRYAVCFATSAFDSPAGNNRYADALEAAKVKVGSDCPIVLQKLPLPFAHPLFIEAQVDRLLSALAWAGLENEALQDNGLILFSAHSIPRPDAETSAYTEQLLRCCRAVMEKIEGEKPSWELVYQSRSGSPALPWLEPDIKDRIREIAAEGRIQTVVVSPIGFFCENFETENDLDFEVGSLCDELGLDFVRAQTVGASPKICRMIREMSGDVFRE